MRDPERDLVRRTHAALRAVHHAFGSPRDVSEDATDGEYDVVVDADALTAVVSGGLTGRSLRTGSVIDGRALARDLLGRDGLDATQRQALVELLAVLEGW